MNYNKNRFCFYAWKVKQEMQNRNIKYQEKFYDEITDFATLDGILDTSHYPEHNDRYFAQCYYNLEEKHDRGIISDEEWQPIEELWCDYIIGDAPHE